MKKALRKKKQEEETVRVWGDVWSGCVGWEEDTVLRDRDWRRGGAAIHTVCYCWEGEAEKLEHPAAGRACTLQIYI